MFWCHCLDIFNAHVNYVVSMHAKASHCFRDHCTEAFLLPPNWRQQTHTAKDTILPYGILGFFIPFMIWLFVSWRKQQKSKID